MKIRIVLAAFAALSAASAPVLAQVPPDIAAGIRKIGQVSDPPNTAKLYLPLFAEQKEPYPNVTVVRDAAYGPDALNKLDVFTPTNAGSGRTVVIYVHGGGFSRGNKREGSSPFSDNIMLWLAQQNMVGVNINYRLAPKNTWPAAQEDLAAAVHWVQQNIAQHGGDPNRIALWGVSAGASLIATYLAHPEFWGPNGHGIKAAVMDSGFYENDRGGSDYFGHDPQELKARSSTEGLKKLTIPLFISHTEVDLPDAIRLAEQTKKALCDAGHCPIYAVFKDHGHISQTYSIGTPDTSVSGPVLQVLQQVK
jgi:dienelactone hydrolase